MKNILCLVFLCALSFSIFGQGNPKQPKLLKKVLTLKMALTKNDSFPGTRGASVAWHPVQKKYYAAMAGNVAYPLCVFDVAGKRLSPNNQKTQMDVRGLWYNPATKNIEGNAYDDGGWFSYKLDKKGMVAGVDTLEEGMNQPTDQSVGVYHPIRKQIMFLENSTIEFWNTSYATKDSTLLIHWGNTEVDGEPEWEDEMDEPEGYNYRNVVYTGLKGAELGFLNTEGFIELYNISNGYMTKRFKLPANTPLPDSFNFAYSNGFYWIFDMEKREWQGYK